MCGKITFYNFIRVIPLISQLIGCCCLSSIHKQENYVHPSTVTDLGAVQFTGNGQLYHYYHQVSWLCFNTSETKVYNCCQIRHFECLRSGPALIFGFCATYSENGGTKSLSIAICPYLRSNGFNMSVDGYVSLPVSLTDLNEYICGPLNRKGLVCSECLDGFGPSFTSYGYKCAKCTNSWYKVPLFLLVYFVPITVLYIFVLVFRISLMTPPMPCFIIYAQLIVIELKYLLSTTHSVGAHKTRLLLSINGDVTLGMKIVHTFYGLFNLQDIFLYVFEPICLSSKVKQIHIALLEYISVFYPICLVLLTWICVHLHGNNFRPVVFLWRPFHKCFVRLRRSWNAKRDIIDVFITFFYLSFSKNLYQGIFLLSTRRITTIDQTGQNFHKIQLSVDPNSRYFGPTHLPFAITAILFLTLFNVLPLLLLILYPFRAFQSCLSKCKLDFCALNIFVDKIQSNYRNGLDGGRDMRSFSALYFILTIGLIVSIMGLFDKVHVLHLYSIWFPAGIFILCTALTVAFVRPYQYSYMNHVDTLLLSCHALQCFALASGFFMIARILLLCPIISFSLIIIMIIIRSCLRTLKLRAVFWRKCAAYCRLKSVAVSFLNRHNNINYYGENSRASSPTAAQPLIQPTYSEISYGTSASVDVQ